MKKDLVIAKTQMNSFAAKVITLSQKDSKQKKKEENHITIYLKRNNAEGDLIEVHVNLGLEI